MFMDSSSTIFKQNTISFNLVILLAPLAYHLKKKGMIIYNCKIYPSGGGVRFDNVHLMTKDGGAVQSPTWTPEIRHSECGQDVSVLSSEQVELKWDSNK